MVDRSDGRLMWDLKHQIHVIEGLESAVLLVGEKPPVELKN